MDCNEYFMRHLDLTVPFNEYVSHNGVSQIQQVSSAT